MAQWVMVHAAKPADLSLTRVPNERERKATLTSCPLTSISLMHTHVHVHVHVRMRTHTHAHTLEVLPFQLRIQDCKVEMPGLSPTVHESQGAQASAQCPGCSHTAAGDREGGSSKECLREGRGGLNCTWKKLRR